ncbi:MAG TPA: serine/threonine-protein kinase [Candidatus Polarisedimenticolaceae bacterium]|nr:serine/threonine-protein kinase [Candidatus Polarisedimenticolaceae bacterium]
MSTEGARTRPRKLGSYEIVEEIGSGGMGVVYLARQPALERAVVLKRMRRDLVDDDGLVERFEREARAAAAVHHQNVVAVYDCFTMRGDHYIAEEYVDGPDLRTILEHVDRLHPRIAAIIGLQVIRGLEEIHARGIVHRDLKPANVLVGSGGETKIADFGIALDGKAYGLTRPGTLMGSVPYLSPEQLLGERVDDRSDLFVFGILLYEMVVGEPPYDESREDSTDTLLERMQNGRYLPPRKRVPTVPRHLARLIKACLQAKPAKRIATATQVRRQLEWHMGRISPADCRYRIAAWLWESGIIARDGDETEARPLAGDAGAGWGDWFRRPIVRWAGPFVLAGLLIGLGSAASVLGLFESDWPELPRQRSGAADLPPVEPTREAAVPVVPPGLSSRGPAADGPRPDSTSESEPAPVALEPAAVRLVASPWARVSIDGQQPFLTPRAAAVPLEPGRHLIVFEHPRFGRAEYEIDLAPGDERQLVHRYEEGQPR